MFRLISTLLLVCAPVLMTACGQLERRVEPTDLFWPAPPDPPRIHYVQSIYNEDDIGRVYSFLEKLFGKSYYDGMIRPYGISAAGGKIVVSDLMLRMVIVFDMEAKRASNLSKEGNVQVPAAVTLDASGNIYVADSGAGKIAVYGGSGAYRTTLLKGEVIPVGLAVNDALKRLYIVDRGKHRVVVTDLKGKRLFEFGGRGTEPGKFNIPLGIAVDTAGQVYVLDSGNFRVQIFTPDGAFLSKFGEVGDRPGMFSNPKGIAVDSDGHIYVTDAAFSNFQIFDQQGRVLLFVGELGMWPGYLHLPGGIAIDEQDRIYIADQLNSRIEVFQYLQSAETATAP